MNSKGYDRYAILEVEDILPRITSPIKENPKGTVHGVPCRVNGLRLFTFKTRGFVCVSCGIVGEFFAIERTFKPSPNPKNKKYWEENEVPYHLNLYAVGSNGQEILMTHDHIVARAHGGPDTISNTQTMCAPCNNEKSKTEDHRYGIRGTSKERNAMASLRKQILVKQAEAKLKELRQIQVIPRQGQSLEV